MDSRGAGVGDGSTGGNIGILLKYQDAPGESPGIVTFSLTLGRRGAGVLPEFAGAFVCKLKAFGENNGCTFQKMLTFQAG